MAEDIAVSQSQRLPESVEVEVERNTQGSSHPEHAQKRKLRSTVWNDFDRTLSSDGTFVAECRFCHKKMSGDSKNGTTHLKSHLLHCTYYKRNRGKQSVVGQMLLKAGEISQDGSTPLECFQFSQEKSREDLAKMIIVHEVPFSFVEHDFFRSFCAGLCPHFKSISRTTVKADCLRLYEKEKIRLYDMLKETTSRVSITADLWTSIGTVSYMALTCHFVDKEWNLQKRILNFVNVKSHSGIEIAKVIKAKLFDWNIDGKICSIVLDNAFSNNVLTRELCQLLEPRGRLLLNGAFFRVRCCCHIINLIVQVGLQPLEMTISKIRESVRHVRSSHVRLENFKKAAEQVNAPKKKLVLDVQTRWNSTYMMLSVALEFRDAFERLSYFDGDYMGPPSQEEWENVKVTKDCLHLFYQVTNRFSGTKYPTANLYFNDVCYIHFTLKKWLKDSHPFIVSMATRMLEKFNKYWSTLSLMLSIGCILDPRYKMKTIEFFFDKIYCDDGGREVITKFDNIRTAFALLYQAYVEEQRQTSSSKFGAANAANDSGTTGSLSMVDGGCGSLSSSYMDFGAMEDLDTWLKQSSANQQNKTDLDLYFELPVLSNEVIAEKYGGNFDVLAWWKEEEGKFPILAKIARDILGVPISTVASESVFSTGGRILDSYRSSLKPSTVESLICCQDWIRNARKGVPNCFDTIPLASNKDAENVMEDDVILETPSYHNDDEDCDLNYNFFDNEFHR